MGHDADDGRQVGSLLDSVGAAITSFTGDCAYDCDDIYIAIAARHPGSDIIVPPRSSAVRSVTA
jgi:hypothetical protein